MKNPFPHDRKLHRRPTKQYIYFSSKFGGRERFLRSQKRRQRLVCVLFGYPILVLYNTILYKSIHSIQYYTSKRFQNEFIIKLIKDQLIYNSNPLIH